MKAIVLKRYGDAGAVAVADVPKPAPGRGDVLVEVHATSVNPVDFKIRDGKLKRILPYPLPLVMGNDLSGVVVEIGADVKGVAVGDSVYARLDKHRIGAFAEYAVVREVDLARKPANLTHEEAASIPLVGLTSWQALLDRAHLTRGQKVLIHAGSGGVGTFAIQLAKHIGATVATTTSEKNAELVRSLGADIVIDYRKERFEDVISDCDVVFDGLGGEEMERSFQVLRRGGVLVTISGTPDPKFARAWGLNPLLVLAISLMSGKVRRMARRRGVSYEFLFMEPSGRQLDQIRELLESGVIKPVIDRVFPLEAAREALAYSESGRARGKVVLKVR